MNLLENLEFIRVLERFNVDLFCFLEVFRVKLEPMVKGSVLNLVFSKKEKALYMRRHVIGLFA